MKTLLKNKNEGMVSSKLENQSHWFSNLLEEARFNVYEKNNCLYITTLVPSLNIEDINVSIDNSVVTVNFSTQFSNEIKKSKVHTVEYQNYSESRSFAIPFNAEIDKIEAYVDKDELFIKIPIINETSQIEETIIPVVKINN
jgi:HSP20 family molecular chaperone IbpA